MTEKTHKDKGGRPVKYTQEYIEKEADVFAKWLKTTDEIFFKQFCIDRGYSSRRLSEFAEANEKFSGVYEWAKEWQEMRLAKGGLTKEFDAGFTKFTMSHVCGWKDDKNITVNSNIVPDWLVDVQGKSKDLINDK